MVISGVHSHFNGLEYLAVRRASLWRDFRSVVERSDIPGRVCRSAVLAKQSVSRLQSILSLELRGLGWTSDRGRPFFAKDGVVVDIQFSPHAEVDDVQDIFRHLYESYEIDVAIEILPMRSIQQRLPPGFGCYEGKLLNIPCRGGGGSGVPLVLVGIE